MPDSGQRAIPALGRRGGGWVAAQLVLIALLVLSALVGLEWPDELEAAAYGVGALLLALGLALLVAGAAGLGSGLTPFPAPRPGKELKTGGIYARSRHPMYGGGILVALGWSVVFATPAGVAVTLLLAILFELKSRREELWLAEHYPRYDEYRRQTRHRFIPFVW